MFCVCVVLKTPSFLLSPILQHEGIANQRQNVLMTVRASSAHGMSSKNLQGGYLKGSSQVLSAGAEGGLPEGGASK